MYIKLMVIIIYAAELLLHNGELRRKNYHLTKCLEYNNLINRLIYLRLG